MAEITKIKLKTKVTDNDLSTISLNQGEPLVNTKNNTLIIGTTSGDEVKANDNNAIILGNSQSELTATNGSNTVNLNHYDGNNSDARSTSNLHVTGGKIRSGTTNNVELNIQHQLSAEPDSSTGGGTNFILKDAASNDCGKIQFQSYNEITSPSDSNSITEKHMHKIGDNLAIAQSTHNFTGDDFIKLSGSSNAFNIQQNYDLETSDKAGATYYNTADNTVHIVHKENSTAVSKPLFAGRSCELKFGVADQTSDYYLVASGELMSNEHISCSFKAYYGSSSIEFTVQISSNTDDTPKITEGNLWSSQVCGTHGIDIFKNAIKLIYSNISATWELYIKKLSSSTTSICKIDLISAISSNGIPDINMSQNSIKLTDESKINSAGYTLKTLSLPLLNVGQLFVDNDFTCDCDIDVNGITATGDINITGNTTTNGNVNITGNITATDDFTTNGMITAKQIELADTEPSLGNNIKRYIIDLIYPVGSVYVTQSDRYFHTGSASEYDVFPGSNTKWEKLPGGYVLMSSGDYPENKDITYTAGNIYDNGILETLTGVLQHSHYLNSKQQSPTFDISNLKVTSTCTATKKLTGTFYIKDHPGDGASASINIPGLSGDGSGGTDGIVTVESSSQTSSLDPRHNKETGCQKISINANHTHTIESSLQGSISSNLGATCESAGAATQYNIDRRQPAYIFNIFKRIS